MEIIKLANAVIGNNSEVCKTLEYSFSDKKIDIGVATITGRYPEQGFVLNKICKELIYILDGKGILFLHQEKVFFSKGDSILIEPNEPYYWESDFCNIAMICTPSWSKEQHEIVCSKC